MDYTREAYKMADTLTCSSDMRIENGSKGDEVTTLQTMLKELGYYTVAADDGATLKIDGDFGDYTEQAVIAFQQANPPLADDGWIGEVSCAKLNARYLEKKGITTTTTTATEVVTKEDKKKSRETTQQKIRDSIKKYNFYHDNNTRCNIDLNGLRLITNTLTPNTPFRKGQWDRTQMMDGSWDVFPKLDAQLKYTLETTICVHQYVRIYPALEKLQSYIINVKGVDMEPGDYTMSVTGVSYVKTSHVKITFELIEVDKLV